MNELIRKALYRFRTTNPIRMVVLGYLSYILIGTAFLCLPMTNTKPTSLLDNLFTATSAVSTTGLTTVTVCDSYNFLGQFIIMILIQLGGIGYMTFSSFIILSTKRSLSDSSTHVMQTVFSIPKNFRIEKFIISVINFTVIIELIGAIGLYFIFWQKGVERPLWSAIFHSVSAFCTAGFSLFPNSFEGMADNFMLNMLIAILSLFGAIGFIVFVDAWRFLKGKIQKVTLTTKIILSATAWILAIGIILIFVTEPFGGHIAPENRLLYSFFQAMSAMTTVGFNTVGIATLSKSVIMLLCILMIIGASPSGTGGGLKTTTFSAIFGLVKSTIKNQKHVTFWHSTVPDDRVKTAVATLSSYLAVLAIGTYLLNLTEKSDFLTIFFEASSALGTVGLSMGLSASLTVLGKIIITLLMFIGRVGPLTFGAALYVKPELIFDNDKTDLAI